MTKIDIIIIGAGPAGMTAALYALRSKNNVMLVENNYPGGQLLKTDLIDNYPGFPKGIKGKDLAENIFSQIKCFDNLIFKTGKVTNVIKKNDLFEIIIDDEIKIKSKAIIIATGGKPKKLNIKGEKKFSGKGVSYCAICDGFFFKNKSVAVIGGGNTAIEDSIYLSKIASDVNLIHRRNDFKNNNYLTDTLTKYKNIKIYLNTIILSINGTNILNFIKLKNIKNNKEFIINVSGLFIAIGQIINTSFLKNILKITNKKHIEVNSKMSTTISGLFACGDIIDKNLFQIATAINDGAIAGQEANNYLKNLVLGGINK